MNKLSSKEEIVFLSVIIPAYNAEKYIQKSILSVIRQEIPKMEIIVVNDGSTDRTAEIVLSLTCEYEYIKLITISNKGVSHARNVGLSLAKGEYITFVDADDYLEKNVYQIMLAEMMKWNADIVEGACRKESVNGRLLCNCSLRKEIVRGDGKCAEHFLKQTNCYNYMCNKIYRRALFQNRSFPLLRYSEDYYMNALLHKEASCKIILNILMYHYVIHEESACGVKINISRVDGMKAGVMTANLYKNTQLSVFPCIYTCKYWIEIVQKICLQNDKKLLHEFIKLSKRDYRSMWVSLVVHKTQQDIDHYFGLLYWLLAMFPLLGTKLMKKV